MLRVSDGKFGVTEGKCKIFIYFQSHARGRREGGREEGGEGARRGEDPWATMCCQYSLPGTLTGNYLLEQSWQANGSGGLGLKFMCKRIKFPVMPPA